MYSTSFALPRYAAMTIVCTAFSHDQDGDLAHLLTVDCTCAEEVEVTYTLVSRKTAR